MVFAIVSGIAISGVYMLLALGFTLLLRIANIVNLAHGAMVVGGMYLTVWLVNYLGLPYLPSIALVVAVGLLPVWLMYELLLRRTLGEGHRPQIIFTLIILSLLEVTYELVFGVDFVRLQIEGVAWDVFGVTLRREVVIGFIIAIVVCAALFLIFRFTAIGKSIEAAGKYPDAAQVIGLPTQKLYRLVFLTGTGMALLAGAILISSTPVTPFLSLDYLLVPVVIALAARLSFVGAVFASLLYGVGYQMLVQLLPSPALATVAIYAVFFALIALTPNIASYLTSIRSTFGKLSAAKGA